MAPDRLLAALLALAFPIFSIWLLARSVNEREQAHAGSSPGLVVLRFTRPWRIWWYVCLVPFATGFASDALLGKIHDDGVIAYLAALVGSTTLFAVGTWFLLRYRVEYDEHYVAVHWPNGRRQALSWREIARIENKNGAGIVVTPLAGKAMVIPSVLPGAAHLIQVAGTRIAGGA